MPSTNPPRVLEIPGLGPSTDRPRLNPHVDLRKLKLSPTEGFVLSRVDGVTGWGDLCTISGLGFEATADILRRLRAAGVVLAPTDPVAAPTGTPTVASSHQGRTSPPPSGPGKPGSPVPTTPMAGGASGPVGVPFLLRLDDGTPVDKSVLADGPGLDVETKTRIVRLHRRLGALAATELLGVEAGAAPSVIKKAYFAASKELHPDRYYGKDLGPYRERLSDIFAACTRAFEALGGDRKKR